MSALVPGSLKRSQRVGPSNDGTNTGSFIVELRSSRQLHMLHLNPRPRDPRFEQEMTLYLQYRKSGPGIMGGPLTMPRRHAQPKQQRVSIPKDPTDFQHPLSVTSETKPVDKLSDIGEGQTEDKTKTAEGNHASEFDSTTVYEDPSNASSLFSSPAHTTPTGNTRSASSVLLALHNQGRLSLSTSLPQIPDKGKTDLKLALSPQSENLKEGGNMHNNQSPLSPKTQTNDASTCPDLFTPRTDQTTKAADITSPKSVPSPAHTSPLNSAAAPDKDLVIFFIHGVGGSSSIWQGQIEYFANLGYEVIAPDLIGHGLSCVPSNGKAYHFKEIAADMEELFDNYCKRKNILVGHSYGASFATVLARTRSRRVTRLVLVSGGCPTPLAPQPGVFTLPYCLLSCIMPCLTRSFYKGAFYSKRKCNGLSAPQKSAFKIPTHVLQHTMNGQDWPDGDELYHNWLTCPTLLVYGNKDKLVTLQEEHEMLKAVFDARLEVIQEASHMVMMEASDQVNSLIHSFLLHPSQPTHVMQEMNNDSANNVNNDSIETVQSSSRSRSNLQSPFRSKSRKSPRSAKTPRSRPQRLLSKSIIV